MTLRVLRQILKGCGEDTRLRILNILNGNVLTVGEICLLLQRSQPTISKHLAQLRLLKMVVDRRVGNLVYYTLNKKEETAQGKIVAFLVSHFGDLEVFGNDRRRLSKERQDQGN